MKKLLPVAGLMMVLLLGCGRQTTRIEGKVSGGDGMALTLERLDVNRTTVIDTFKIRRGGAFSIPVKLKEPELFILKDPKGRIVNLLLSPGEKVSVHTDTLSFSSNYTVDGSGESENIRILVMQLNRTRNAIDSLVHMADSIGDPENPQMELIRNAYTQAIIRQKRFTIRYLVEHMSSLSSVYALYQKYDPETPILGTQPDLQYFISVADSLQSAYPNSSLTKSLLADIENKKANYNFSNRMEELIETKGEEVGSLELSIPDRGGEEIALSSLKGKVVLVVFWASTNEKSLQALLTLQSTYSRYHGKGFEIYAVSLDNNKINWMQAIDFNEFKWINVSELSYPDSRANVLYNVTSLPSDFLINREGDIVAKNLFGKRLETWLDNLI